jgi:DNA-binding CsgD family transcriptional regulator
MLMLLAASLAPDAATAADFADALDRWIAERRWSGGRPSDVSMIQAQLDAERHRDDPELWGAVADAWDRASRTPHAAYARLRQAEGHVAMGDRAAAETALQDADAMATRMGFAWLGAGTAALARAHNLDLGVALVPATPAERAGLTAREREVLELLSEGRTNRQIGEVLFISTKTASVHVSNILAKLQVANRGEAAATARRLGLVA